MEERKNWSNVLHLEMGGEYDAVHRSSSILRRRQLSPNNQQWRNTKMTRSKMLLSLMQLEDVIRLANSSMCHPNAAGQDLKKNG
jgi:hypothetical protein